jgi:tetratricopeptide (TPR) repeat protein
MVDRLLLRLVALAVGALVVIQGHSVQAGSAPADDPPSRSWKRLKSLAFTAIGDASERDMRDALRELEAHRLARLALAPWLVSERPTPVTLVVFRDGSDLGRFTQLDHLNRPQGGAPRSFLLRADTETFLLVSNDVSGDRSKAFSSALREYTSVLVDENLPYAPPWLRRGLVDLFSTYVPRSPSGDRIFGRPSADMRQPIEQIRLLPLARLVTASERPREPAGQAPFAVSAWRLTHYLLFGPPERTRRLTQYLTLLERGVPSSDAFPVAFETGLEEFHAQLEQYYGPDAWLLSPEAVDATLVARSVEPLRESEVAALQGELLVLSGRYEPALKLLDAALAIDPQSADARLARSEVLLDLRRDAEAFALIDGLDRTGSSSARANLAVGHALSALGRHVEALEYYRRATAASPRSLPAWSGLSVSATVSGRTAEAENASTIADRLSPTPIWRYHRAIALMRAQNTETEIIRDVQHMRQTGRVEGAYPAFLAALAHRRLGQDAEAKALLADVASQLQRNSWPWKIAAFLQGDLAATALLSEADDDGQRTEAHSYVGFVASVAGRVDEAMPHFRWVIEHRLRSFTEYTMVSNELRRLGVKTEF